MPFFKWSSVVLISMVIFLGCGLKEGVIQKDSQSYLLFTGNTQSAVAYIDDFNPINLTKKINSASENNGHTKYNKETLYEISPGKHKVIVKKDGNVIVERVLLLSGGITKEINIP
ncbi:hypothetical protein DSCO28_02880 [Desulfosarcina ovata subsp. sediminis]|uniref:Lipoprotein n=1 Tax=Desulfosarcina ovata subsp. sediminis TaxID=885957 RepID=A0A5K7ZCK1_9BACT|nr:hypothetical protein [Desulfosarcina ovata]BBO79722.1 hypothetical protein DSCO28_02880 [Desulfosarcina ovata subsp. sediminis]